MSSGAAEVYAAGNATQDFLHLSYVAEELGIGFELPFNLQIDNTAAEAFANDTVIKTKLKHIAVGLSSGLGSHSARPHYLYSYARGYQAECG